MSVYNHPKRIKKTVDSVLKQSFKNFEFIIVNDGSTEDVDSILNHYAKKDKRIKLIKNKKNFGLTKSLNKALKKSRGTYIARIDSGDICKKYRLKLQKEFLDKNPDYAIVGSFIKIINEGGKKIGKTIYPVEDYQIKNALIRTNPFCHSTWMLRKKVLNEMGFYNSEFKYTQDYELLLRVGSKYKLKNLNEFLVDYLYDAKGISISFKRKEQDRFALRARYLALTKYNYSKKHWFDFLIAFAEYLIPFKIKILLVKNKKRISIREKKIIFNKL